MNMHFESDPEKSGFGAESIKVMECRCNWSLQQLS